MNHRPSKYLLGIFLLLTGHITLGQSPDEIRQVWDGNMRPDAEVKAFINSDKLFPVRVVSRGKEIRPLPVAEVPLKNVHFEANGKPYDLFDYLAVNRVAGLLILKDGKVALEDYELGLGSDTYWPSFSMAKSVSSTLIGAAVQDGYITSLDDPVTKYLPALKDGAYEGVSVRNLIQMTSGVKWDETYVNPNSDRRKLLELQIQKKPGLVLTYVNSLARDGAPGTIWKYNTGDTFVVGALLESATHRPLATYLSEKIWSQWGMEHDAKWWLESPNGMGWGGGGLASTLRDFGRIALLVLNDGVIDGKRLVPQGWFDEAGSRKQVGGKWVDYGYLWWVLPKGEPMNDETFEARGIFGQHMYINRAEKLAIVVLSARPKPTGSTVIDDPAFFAAVARALR